MDDGNYLVVEVWIYRLDVFLGAVVIVGLWIHSSFITLINPPSLFEKIVVELLVKMGYVGSAYGDEGILGRWKSYAKNGHGGNKLLKSLVNRAPNYKQNLRFTVLRTLSKILTKKEVIEYESQ